MAKTQVLGEGVCPVTIAPAKPTAEFAKINGAESAAVCLGEAQYKAIKIGARNTPPPTPVSPETKPTMAPIVTEPHKGVCQSGSPSCDRRKTRMVAAERSTRPVTIL